MLLGDAARSGAPSGRRRRPCRRGRRTRSAWSAPTPPRAEQAAGRTSRPRAATTSPSITSMCHACLLRSRLVERVMHGLETRSGAGRRSASPAHASDDERRCRSARRHVLRSAADCAAASPCRNGTTPGISHLSHISSTFAWKYVEVLLGEVGEAALLQEVLAHRLARPALDDGLGLAVVLHHAVLDLVEREDARSRPPARPARGRASGRSPSPSGTGSSEWMKVGPPMVSARRTLFIISTA